MFQMFFGELPYKDTNDFKDFKKEYPGLMPRVKNMRLKYDINSSESFTTYIGNRYNDVCIISLFP